MSRSRQRLIKDFQNKKYAQAYVKEFLNTSIATQIKVLREQREWTQNELASRVGMKQSRISLLENVYYDRWSISTLQKLADAFDVTLKVSFETFSDCITDMLNLSRESLQRRSRIDDLSSTFKGKGKAKLKDLALANQLSFDFGNFPNFNAHNLFHIHQKTGTALNAGVYQLKDVQFQKAASWV